MRVLHLTRTLPQEMLGPMVLSRVVKDAGHDMKAICLPDPLWLRKIHEYRPDVITYSLMTGNHRPIYDVNRYLKSKFDFFALMGGPHATFVPDTAKQPGVDAICIGEGEGAMVDLLNALQWGADWRGIQNLCWAEKNGELHKNPVRPLIQDLDSIGIPDRSVIYDAQPLYRNSPRKVVVTQRGCPMSCTFCFHHAWRGKIYNARLSEYVRKRSVSSVLEEVTEIRGKYPLQFVHFVDDIFNIKSDWLAEFSERWPKEVGLPFDAILMANMTKEEHIKQLKHAGCVYARIAFEAANDHVRNDIFKKNTERRHLTDTSAWIKKHGIRLGSLNMLGAPGGTLEDDFETVKLNIECKVDHPLCSIVQPYPEFEINEITKNMGIAVAEYDEFPSQFNRTASIDIPDKHAVENLHKWFPVLVRHPKWVPIARKTVGKRWLRKPLLVMYTLYSEWLVTEQNILYRNAQGIRGMRIWAPIDFLSRVFTKGFIRILGMVGAKAVAKMAPKIQMGDERVVAHMD